MKKESLTYDKSEEKKGEKIHISYKLNYKTILIILTINSINPLIRIELKILSIRNCFKKNSKPAQSISK